MSSTPPQAPPETPRPPRRTRPEIAPETLAAYSRFSGWLILALILTYTGLQLPLPWRLLAVVAGLAGVIGGVILLIRCLRQRLPVFMLISAVIVLVSCGAFTAIASAQVVFWQATADFDQCRSQAVTERSMNQCFTDYEDDMLSVVPGMP